MILWVYVLMSLLDVILVVDIRMMVYDTILEALLTTMMPLALYYYNTLCSMQLSTRGKKVKIILRFFPARLCIKHI